jgi:hypothetical protein
MRHTKDMYFSTDDMTNAVIAGGASIPTWMAAVQDVSDHSYLYSLLASFVLFILGKLVDFSIRLYWEKRFNNGRGVDGKTTGKKQSSEDTNNDA